MAEWFKNNYLLLSLAEGKIKAVQFARENNIPFFGICLGMQMAVIEYSRNILGLTDANSTEMNPGTEHPVISLMEEQKTITDKGDKDISS